MNIPLNDKNTVFAIVESVTIPITWRPLTKESYGMAGAGFEWQNSVALFPYGDPSNPAGQTIPPGSAWFSPYSTSSVGAWVDGGNATLGRSLSLGANSAPRLATGAQWVDASTAIPPHGEAHGMIYTSTLKSHLTDSTFEIDWGKTMERVNQAYSNKLCQIGDAEFTDINGVNAIDLVKEGYVDLASLQAQYTSYDPQVSNISAPVNFADTETTIQYETTEKVTNSVYKTYAVVDYNKTILQGSSPNSTFTTDVQSLGSGGGSASDTRTIPMYLTVYFINLPAVGETPKRDYKDPEAIKQEDDSANDDAVTTGNGSTGQGLNETETEYGNSVLPFDSVYLSGSNYSSFYNAGGGIVSESGVFPNSAIFFVDKVRLSCEGSTATLVEHVKFDATPSLTVGEKLFIYILDSTNPYQPCFCGYVSSYSRELTSDDQKITYECKDLVGYLSQFVSPSYFIYRPPAVDSNTAVKTYGEILKSILNSAGVPNAVVDLPAITSQPVNWVYEPLDSVLEWAIKMFGKYIYYVDRNGLLNICSTDGGSLVKSFRIPTEGEAVGTNVVKSFSPIVDTERSRSRIILTGDFELTEHKVKLTYHDTTREFIFRTQDPLIDRLISNPQSGPEVEITGREGEYVVGGVHLTFPIDFQKKLSITQLSTAPGDSFIYINDSTLDYNGKTFMLARYATRSNNPLQVYIDTGLPGGTVVINRPEFKKVTASTITIDDTALMQQYLSLLKEYFKPVYGGLLSIIGLDTSLKLLDKVSITNTSLPSAEASNLIIYELEFDVVNKITTLNLSNRVYADLPFFDILRERSRNANESLVKAGLVEQDSLYKRV